jgi:hypothetical protein
MPMPRDLSCCTRYPEGRANITSLCFNYGADSRAQQILPDRNRLDCSVTATTPIF